MNRQPVPVEVIDALRSQLGGFSRASLLALGVPYPPPDGWRHALEHGLPLPDRSEQEAVRVAAGGFPDVEYIRHGLNPPGCEAVESADYAVLMALFNGEVSL